MKRYILLIFIIVTTFSAFAQDNASPRRPKLVVGLVVDQMRWDYLYRFKGHYGQGGFKRLMNEGFNCQNTMVNYVPSFTAPGHSCIYTGSVPAIHGIAGNDWADNLSSKKTYCVTDNSVRNIINGDTVQYYINASGDTVREGMSPQNLLTTTITDELKLATNFRSKVYGVALKDRGSILPAGHLGNGAYWFDTLTGSFGSSTYYKKHSYPAWLKRFNARHVADSLIKQDWNMLDKTGAIYTESTADANEYERKFDFEDTPAFPHYISKLMDAGKYKPYEKYKAFVSTPGGDVITFEMAKACMEGAHLGKGDYTDFLCVSLSTPDYIGHQFAPNSVEIEDEYIRLDKEIAAFLNYLDATMGQGNYLLFLTADHGGAHNITFLKDNQVPADTLSTSILKKLNTYLTSVYGVEPLVTLFKNYQFYLNENLIFGTDTLNRDKIKQSALTWLGRRPEYDFVIDMDNIDGTPLPEPLRSMVANGHHHRRSGAIEVIPHPAWYEGGKTGTTHGTWNPYDAHIPLLWYGWNIPKGETHSVVNMTDISATLAALLHIQMPNGCIGKPISEIVK